MNETICPHCNATLDSRHGTDWHKDHFEVCQVEQTLGKALYDSMEHLDPTDGVPFEEYPERQFYVYALNPVLAFHQKEIMRWYELCDERKKAAQSKSG